MFLDPSMDIINFKTYDEMVKALFGRTRTQCLREGRCIMCGLRVNCETGDERRRWHTWAVGSRCYRQSVEMYNKAIANFEEE